MTEDIEFKKKKPPAKYSLKSWRLYISLLMMFGLFTRTSMRSNMAIAVVCMVNSSYLEKTPEFGGNSSESGCGRLSSEKASELGYNGDLPWTQNEINQIFSANFYGVLSSVWIGGYFSDKFDPKTVVLIATFNSVIWTLLTPFLARTSVRAVFVGRYLLGLGEGFIMPAIFSIASRIFQVFGNIGTACCFLVLAFFVDCDTVPLAVVVLATYGLFISCGVLGFYTSLLSIAPRFAGTVASISLLIASLVHSLVPMLMGFLNKNGTREEWKKIWLFAVFLHCLGAIVFGTFGSAEIQEWAKFVPESNDEEKLKLNKIIERKKTDEL